MTYQKQKPVIPPNRPSPIILIHLSKNKKKYEDFDENIIANKICVNKLVPLNILTKLLFTKILVRL